MVLTTYLSTAGNETVGYGVAELAQYNLGNLFTKAKLGSHQPKKEGEKVMRGGIKRAVKSGH